MNARTARLTRRYAVHNGHSKKIVRRIWNKTPRNLRAYLRFSIWSGAGNILTPQAT